MVINTIKLPTRNYQKWIFILGGIYLFLSILDILTTCIGLNSGYTSEVNPIMKLLVPDNPFVISFKVIYPIVFTGLMYLFVVKKFKSAKWEFNDIYMIIFGLFVFAQCLVVVFNIATLSNIFLQL